MVETSVGTTHLIVLICGLLSEIDARAVHPPHTAQPEGAMSVDRTRSSHKS